MDKILRDKLLKEIDIDILKRVLLIKQITSNSRNKKNLDALIWKAENGTKQESIYRIRNYLEYSARKKKLGDCVYFATYKTGVRLSYVRYENNVANTTFKGKLSNVWICATL